MQLDKYYTPSIEEFYIGFEYQALDENCQEYNNTIYGSDPEIPILDSDESCIYSIEEQLNNNEIRVKYLDLSDLEELGFEYYSYFRDGGTSVFRTSNKEYELHFYRTNSIPDIDPDKINIIRHHENPSLKGQIFSGNIKNKSELKKLLKQLNIWN